MKLLDQLQAGEQISPSDLLGALTDNFPLIEQLEATPQDPEWHAEGNVRIHTERVIAEAYQVLENEGADLEGEDRVAMILGAALHDVGKALTTKEKEIEGRIRIVSPHHTSRGFSYAAPRLPEIGVRDSLFRKVLSIVSHHHAPKKLIVKRGDLTPHFWRLSRAASPRMLYLFELADLRGRDLANGKDKEGFELLEMFRLGAEEAGVWQRDDIYADWKAQIAGLLPDASPEEQQYVLDTAIEDFEEGRIHTPEEAVSRTYDHRASYPEVLVTCGASGSGKSTFVENHCQDWERISLDGIREEIDRKADDGYVMQLAKERLKEHLRARKRIVWDATCLRQDGRAKVLKLGRDYHARTHIAAFAIPPDLLLRQNKDRATMIPSKVIAHQLDRLQWPEVWEAHQLTFHFPKSK